MPTSRSECLARVRVAMLGGRSCRSHQWWRWRWWWHGWRRLLLLLLRLPLRLLAVLPAALDHPPPPPLPPPRNVLLTPSRDELWLLAALVVAVYCPNTSASALKLPALAAESLLTSRRPAAKAVSGCR